MRDEHVRRPMDENDIPDEELLAIWSDAQPVELASQLVIVSRSPLVKVFATGIGSAIRNQTVDDPCVLLR